MSTILGVPTPTELIADKQGFEWVRARVLVREGCWLWSGAHDRTGYAKVTAKIGDHVLSSGAHRLVYHFAVGPIPDGLDLDHLCRNRGCVRPDHLEPVSHAENVQRGRDHMQGENLHPLHLRRRELGLSVREVADQLDSYPATIIRWERGQNRPSPANLARWQAALS